MSVCLTSCGGDDAEGGGNSHNVDGVNVISGKKMTEMNLVVEKDLYSNHEDPIKIKIDYDSKGRLSRVYINTVNSSTNEAETFDLMSLDYDLREVKIYRGWDYYENAQYITYAFMLNNNGYISQISNCSCTYDNNGYLIGADSSKEIFTLSYNDGDLIKSVCNNIVKGKTKLYYIYSGEDKKTGELYFTMSSSEDLYYTAFSSSSIRALMVFIAYQSGLFGKISKYCVSLSKSNENSAIFTKRSESGTKEIRIRGTFKFK